MKTIWKYTINPEHEINTFHVPEGSEILDIMEQNNELCMWIQVDDSMPKTERKFRVFGTGHIITDPPGHHLRYQGTASLHGGELIFHVYEMHKVGT